MIFSYGVDRAGSRGGGLIGLSLRVSDSAWRRGGLTAPRIIPSLDQCGRTNCRKGTGEYVDRVGREKCRAPMHLRF